MSDVLIGVDVGTTVLKAAAFDARTGRALAQVTRGLKVKVGGAGEREQSPASLDRTLRAAFSDLRKRLGRRWRAVSGIGLAAQGGSAIIADRRTGRALTPMMLWNDTRAFGYLPRITERTTTSFWRRHTLRDQPGWGLARILWLKKSEPDLLKDENIYVGAGEYCYFRMTGIWRQDAGSALQVGCYNARLKRLDQRLFDPVGMPISFVAPMREGHEMHSLSREGARRLGLRPAIPVAGPYMDHEAGYLSALGTSKRPLQCSLGTAWVGNFTVTEGTKWTSPFQLVLPSVAGKGWLVVQPLLTGNVTLDWALGQFVDPDHEKALRKLAGIFGKDLLPPAGLTALPWLNMPNPFLPSAIGAGGFFGMGPRTGSEELLRALAAAMVCEMARVFTQVKAKKKVDSVVLGGGASKGRFFRTLLSALFDPLPVHWQNEGDLAGTRGALYAFNKTVAKAKTARCARPDKALRSRVEAAYEQYMAVFERVCGRVPTGMGIEFRSL